MDKKYPIVSHFDYARLRVLDGDSEFLEELERSIVVHSERIPKDVVTMHSRLIYIDEYVGIRREVELVYPEEANPATGRVSVLAPVGSALLGLAEGSSIDWRYPSGEIHRLRVERVLSQPHPVADEHPEPDTESMPLRRR